MWEDRVRKFLALALVTVLAVSMLGLAGCSSSEEATDGGEETATGTIKIGVHTSLTGGLADYGYTAAEGAKLAASKFEEIEVDGTTYTVELVIKDDKGEPSEAPIVAQQLIDDGVVAVVGPLTSGNANAALPIYKEAGIPVISPSATRADLVKQGWDNFFRTAIGDNVQGANLAEWITELGAKKVAIMDDRGDYSVGLADVIEDGLASGDVEVLRQEGQEGDVDFSAQVSNIKAFAPDVVLFTGYHREFGLLVKQATEAGIEAQFMGGDGVKSDDLPGEAGGAENVEGALCTVGGIPQDSMAAWDQFVTDYETATGGKEPAPYSETNHDAVVAIIKAIEAAGSVEPADILEALRTIEVTEDAVTGQFTFSDSGEYEAIGESAGLATIVRYKMAGGAWETVE